jgi:hypothetical protein
MYKNVLELNRGRGNSGSCLLFLVWSDCISTQAQPIKHTLATQLALGYKNKSGSSFYILFGLPFYSVYELSSSMARFVPTAELGLFVPHALHFRYDFLLKSVQAEHSHSFLEGDGVSFSLSVLLKFDETWLADKTSTTLDSPDGES